MKTKEMVASLSIGMLIMFCGTILTGIALSEALLATFPEWPRWVAYLLIGGLSIMAGGISIYIGTDEAHDKMESVEESVDPRVQVTKHPWAAIGASVACGFAIAQLLKGSPFSSGKKQAVSSSGRSQNDQSNGHSEKDDSSLMDFINDHLNDIGQAAGQQVTSMAMHVGTKALTSQLMNIFGMANEQGKKKSSSSQEEYHQPNGSPRF